MSSEPASPGEECAITDVLSGLGDCVRCKEDSHRFRLIARPTVEADNGSCEDVGWTYSSSPVQQEVYTAGSHRRLRTVLSRICHNINSWR